MTNKEKLHQILSSLWKNDDSVGKIYYNQALQDVQTAIDLQEEPIGEDLEKASYYFACKCNPLKTEYSTTSPNPEVIEAFKAGAKWKEQQMMAKAIDTHCFGFQSGALFTFRLPAGSYLVGSKVKVIIKQD